MKKRPQSFRNHSKSEIRAWLKTDEGQAWLKKKIDEKCAGKSEIRKRRDMARMKRMGLHVDCTKCLHKIGHHCSWDLPDGCLDYFEVGTGREFHDGVLVGSTRG